MKTRDLDWQSLRELLLYGFSDAAGFERNASKIGSPYEQVQSRIIDVLRLVFLNAGEVSIPVVIVAHSLGCHVISNYIWDAQRPASSVPQGVWRNQPATTARGENVEDEAGSRENDGFFRLRSLRFLYTTGCNIPIFVAGFPRSKIVPVATKGTNYRFDWKNFYDQDDALGWPLRPLNAAYSRAGERGQRGQRGAVHVTLEPTEPQALLDGRRCAYTTRLRHFSHTGRALRLGAVTVRRTVSGPFEALAEEWR